MASSSMRRAASGWRCGAARAVRRYLPDGQLERTIPLPVSLTTKCAFGGPNLDDLYVTSAWIDLTAAERVRQPAAGGLFHLKPGVRGKPRVQVRGLGRRSPPKRPAVAPGAKAGRMKLHQ